MNGAKRIVAEFPDHDAFVAALKRLRASGHGQIETFTPYPSEEIAELVPGPKTPMGWIMLAGAIGGGSGAYLMEWWAAHDFPYNVGGRPLTSWPSFIPVMFELTVLSASITGLVALICLCRLPRLDHPMFELDHFERASQDHFFVAVAVAAPEEESAIRALAAEAGAISIQEAPA